MAAGGTLPTRLTISKEEKDRLRDFLLQGIPRELKSGETQIGFTPNPISVLDPNVPQFNNPVSPGSLTVATPYVPRTNTGETPNINLPLNPDIPTFNYPIGGDVVGGGGVGKLSAGGGIGTGILDQRKAKDNFSYLGNLYGQPLNLREKATTFAGVYPNKQFQDYLSSINAPSSVDVVRKEVESDALRQIYEDIDRELKQAIGTSRIDFMERGLAGPGQISDIEQNALAQLKAGAIRSKAQAGTQIKLAEIERQKEKEKAVTEAYGKQYESFVKGALSDQAIQNRLLETESITNKEISAKGLLALADIISRRDALLAELQTKKDLGRAELELKKLLAEMDNVIKREEIAAGINVANIRRPSESGFFDFITKGIGEGFGAGIGGAGGIIGGDIVTGIGSQFGGGGGSTYMGNWGQ